MNWKNYSLVVWILNGHLIHLRFADDIALFSEIPTKLETVLLNFVRESKIAGHKINAKN